MVTAALSPAERRLTFPGWPCFGEEEIAAATEVLRSGKVNYWTGDEGRRFEREFAAAVDCNRAVAVANGTVALELALHSLGVGLGDGVVVTSRTFIASASCVVMRGARPVFADVDRNSQNITAETISAVLSPRTKAIIAVHLAGLPCDMDPILELARERGICIIEDCAQVSPGTTYKGRSVGSLGDVAAFSFCQDKIITTCGEGGMLTTNSEDIWNRAWSFKDHGKGYESVYRRKHPPGFRWVHESFGTNFRLTEMQSTVGRIALCKLPDWLALRRRNAAILNDRLADLPALRLAIPPADIEHAYYKYYAFIRPDRLRAGWTRDRIMQAIAESGVPCFSGSCSEIYLEKAFSLDLRPPVRLPVARELGETALMLLVHPTLEPEHMHQMADVITDVVQHASR